MNPRLVLVGAISLLYCESLQENGGSNSADIVRTALDLIKMPEVSSEGDRAREILVALSNTATWLAETPSGVKHDRTALLQRIRVDTGDDENLYMSFSELFSEDPDQSKLLEVSKTLRNQLYQFVKETEVGDILNDLHRNYAFNRSKLNLIDFIRDSMARLEPFGQSAVDQEKLSFVGRVDLTDPESIKEKMLKAKEILSEDGIIGFGIQAINRMFGRNMGSRRGETIVVGALQSNYKSGFSMTLLKHAALYNKPYMKDPTKKPLILRISLENELEDDIMWFYKSLKENETSEFCDIRDVDIDEAAKYVTARMGVNGYHFIMERHDPSDFGFHDLFDVINDYESEGYEIHLLNVDYLNMMNKRGCNQGPTGSDTRDLFRRVRNFTSRRGITFITPHQLSSEAKQLIRNGVDNFVCEIANKGYWDSCRTLDQEVDMEIYVNKEKSGAEYYLTVARGKHRGVEVTPDKDLYTVLRMHRIGALREDINGPDMSLRSVGGSTVASGGAAAWTA